MGHVPFEHVLCLLVTEGLGSSREGSVRIKNSMSLSAPMGVGPGGGLPVPSKRLGVLLLVVVRTVVRGRGTRVVRVLVDCRLVVMTERERERE